MKQLLVATALSMEALACMLEGAEKLAEQVKAELDLLAAAGANTPIDVQRITVDLITYTNASMAVIDAVISIASATQRRLLQDALAISDLHNEAEQKAMRAVLKDQSKALGDVVLGGEAFKRAAQGNLALAKSLATGSAAPTEIVASLLERISKRDSANGV